MDTIPLPTLPNRPADSHKGDYGKVLIIAGSDTMIGAPALAALAALRAGAGLVRIAVPKEIIPAVLTICPQATAFPWSATKIKDLLAFADSHDVLAVGPGLGSGSAVKRLILELLERHHGPMVFDADALNVLATLEPSEWPKRRNWANIVLTPHMGEYMRLIAAVMKRGANVALAPTPAGDALQDGGMQTPGTGKKAKPKPKPILESDDAPSTADGIALHLPDPPPEPPAYPCQMNHAQNEDPNSTIESTPESEIENQKSKIDPPPPDRTPLAELLARGTGAIVVLKGHRTVITDGHQSTINLNGDYLSDALAAQVGGIGIAPGGNINYLTGHAIFEATHGTAPKYANLDVVNPGSVILSGVMMLEYLRWHEAAAAILKGLETAIHNKTVTYDFARLMPGATKIKCSQFADEIIKHMG